MACDDRKSQFPYGDGRTGLLAYFAEVSSDIFAIRPDMSRTVIFPVIDPPFGVCFGLPLGKQGIKA
ncbi:MAG: hypothetical protein R2874_14925 [Desulfobacterales bacterium]